MRKEKDRDDIQQRSLARNKPWTIQSYVICAPTIKGLFWDSKWLLKIEASNAHCHPPLSYQGTWCSTLKKDKSLSLYFQKLREVFLSRSRSKCYSSESGGCLLTVLKSVIQSLDGSSIHSSRCFQISSTETNKKLPAQINNSTTRLQIFLFQRALWFNNGKRHMHQSIPWINQ